MANEITINTTNAIVNNELKKATQKIAKVSASMNKNLFEMAIAMTDAKTAFDQHGEEIAETDKLKNFGEYAKNILNVNRATAYNYVNICENFIDKTAKTANLEVANKAWTMSQLGIIYNKLKTFDTASEAIENGAINSDMSCRELEEACNKYIAGDEVETEEEAEETEEVHEVIEAEAKEVVYKCEFTEYEDGTKTITVNGEVIELDVEQFAKLLYQLDRNFNNLK